MAIQKISGVTIDLIDQAAGDVAYYDSEVNSWVRLAKGVAGEVLTMNESETAPQWGAAPPTWSPLGTLRGYSSGGNTGLHSATSRYDRIDNYSFTSDSVRHYILSGKFLFTLAVFYISFLSQF